MSEKPKSWFVYVLRCADNSLYTGITLNIDKRLDEHNGIEKNGAKYTHSRRPVELAYLEATTSRSSACKREHAIKNLKKSEKEILVRKKNVILDVCQVT
ncbi:hypothetical protein MNBD_GAMMA06-945 [hydrothermal vent metagenome]|uniref:GIY-YIG domain-containing protein n=1 Tax=hydrothermal vent metagenome TaxID=652676 RepID=A0A3B0W618_9ZZZZ